MRPLPTAILAAATAALTANAAAQSPPATLTLPAFTGYAHPDPNAMRRRDDGSVERCTGSLHFYVHLEATGELGIRLERTPGVAPHPDQPTVLTIAHDTGAGTATANLASATDVGTFAITTPGYHKIVLTHPDGSPLRNLKALHLSGPAAVNAHANTLERRNAASVHLGYPVPQEVRDDVEWFYLELTPKLDPLWTYYMATGWHRGYFGIQVNSATERRVIFSVWDAGSEAIDRTKVGADDRVTLIQKGDGVHAGDFGNEGTGGHSHLQHDWRLGDTFRFLLHARVDGDATIYSGWFWFAAKRQWGLIASFRAPKDGKRPRGLYSFAENFSGANGDAGRECEFGNGWVRTTKGDWLPLREARFTHDETGKDARRDRWAGVRGTRFYLRHGDFTSAPADAVTAYRALLHLPAHAGERPNDAELPSPPGATIPR